MRYTRAWLCSGAIALALQAHSSAVRAQEQPVGAVSSAQPAPATTTSARPPVVLTLEGCEGIALEDVRRSVGIELGAQPVSDAAPGATRAAVRCTGTSAAIHVDDPLTNKSVARTVDLRSVDPGTRTRLLALAVVELIAASWSELESNPHPAVPAASGESPGLQATQDAAREALRARATQMQPGGSEPRPAVAPAPDVRAESNNSAVDPNADAASLNAARETEARIARRERTRVLPARLPTMDGFTGLVHTAVTELPRRPSVQLLAGGAADLGRNGQNLNTYFAAASVAPIRNLELFANAAYRDAVGFTVAGHDVRGSTGAPTGIGFGATGMFSPRRGLALGATVVTTFRHIPGIADPTFSNLDLRLQATADFAALHFNVPLRIHVNAGYNFDESANLVSAYEHARQAETPGYDATICDRTPTANSMDPRNNLAACHVQVTPLERYGWRVQHADMLWASIALDVLIPGPPQLRPFIEYTITAPVIRSNYVCWRGSAGPSDTDRCLASPGNNAFARSPSFLTLGVRVSVPSWSNLSAQAALDIATGGADGTVRELAPIAPFTLHLALGMPIEFGGTHRTDTARHSTTTAALHAARD